MIKVGDLVRIREPFMGYQGQVGIVTKIPMTERGMWAILLTSGELLATMNRENLEVLNG